MTDDDDVNPETLADLVCALGDLDHILDTIASCAPALGITRQQAAERLLSAVRHQRHEAMEVLSDADLPPGVLALAEEAARGSGQPVTGVKHAGDGGYALYTTGNPIVIEAWARRHGARAQAHPAHCVIWIDDPHQPKEIDHVQDC